MNQTTKIQTIMRFLETIKQLLVLPILVVLLMPLIVKSQTYTIDTILYNGDPNKFINIVYLGDGYTTNELSSFTENTTNSTNYLFTIQPLSQYKNYFNVYTIKVNSAESGSDHPRTASDCPPESSHPLLNVNTHFNSTFDYFSIHRLLVATNNAAAFNVLLNNYPLYDNALMLVNTPYYGGSGGWLATASTNTSSNEILIHEIGHSFANLADEYWAGEVYAAEKSNMSQQTNPDSVKWKNWIGHNNVGIYPYATSGVAANWYRPHNNCKMRALNNPFCPVCQEAITLKTIEKFGSPIMSYFPEEYMLELTEDSIQFSIDLVKPNPNTLRIKWILNGTVLPMNMDSMTIFSGQLIGGKNVLQVEVLDTTNIIRADNHVINNTFNATWNIDKTTTNILVTGKQRNIIVYPIPVLDNLTIEIEDNNQEVHFEIFNSLGHKVFTGNLVEKTTVQTSSFAPGVYIIVLENGQLFEFKKIIKQ